MSSIVKAASVLLVRGKLDAEFYLVRRAAGLRFFGGFVAFPGGKVAPSDRDIPVLPDGDSQVPNERIVAGARELFEETGVLIARRGNGSLVSSGSLLTYLRRKVSEDNLGFAKVLSRLGLAIHAADFKFLGSATTPPFLPHRFDTAFLLAQLPLNQEAVVWPGELDSGEWATPDAMLERWTQGNCLVSPPTVLILELLREQSIDQARAGLAALFQAHDSGAIPPIFFAPRVQMIPLHTQALPPSTHTNAYLVGSGPVYLIDPGAVLADEQRRLFAAVDEHQACGPRLTAVVLTHHHPDHIGAADACAERYDVPILSHAITAALLDGQIRINRTIADGDRLDLGEAPDGTGPWYLQAIHTPGHAPGHLAFFDPHYRLLYVGDMVSTLSSVVIAPPDGDLTLYLDSLRRLRTYECRLLLPAHGSPSARAHHVLDECIAHRVRRQSQLLAALRTTPRTVAELSQELYKGLQPNLVRFAELQVTAGLKKLEQEEMVALTPDGWVLQSLAGRHRRSGRRRGKPG